MDPNLMSCRTVKFVDRIRTAGGRRRAALGLYEALLRQARSPGFFRRFAVRDDVDGRFDSIALHVFLLLNRLAREGGNAGAEALGQAFFDLMFADMDRSLREMGVGDLGVARRIKDMVTAFYGRMAAYEEALAADDRALGEALIRNLYRGQGSETLDLSGLTAYVRDQARELAEQDIGDLTGGRVRFAPLSESKDPGAAIRTQPSGSAKGVRG